MSDNRTTELREKLDALGVEHYDTEHMTEWHDVRGLKWNYFSDGENTDLTLETPWEGCTPEQAIAATLGSGTLTAEQVRVAIFNGSSYASYDGAKYYADGISMQAIADELNATLGGGECENVSEYAKECNHFKCSECGCAVEDAEGYYVSVHGKNWEHQLPWSFCPNCGARVRKKVGE